ncbi:prepilin-type N-terminal cleavage/methylation domain-containing protein [Desulfobacterales bacterium HSG16]|nr:prepilin-type N-terminal cleavage/methylation domain-containing protein [Desulfobacterales bacterium HSG16]
MNKKKLMSSTSKGFTLIEVLIAMFILTVGMLAMAGQLANTIVNNDLAKKRSVATNLAQDKMEEIQNAGFSDAAAGTTSEVIFIYTREWTVTDDSPGANMKTIEVKVSWASRTSASLIHEMEMKTILAK